MPAIIYTKEQLKAKREVKFALASILERNLSGQALIDGPNLIFWHGSYQSLRNWLQSPKTKPQKLARSYILEIKSLEEEKV